MIKARPFKTIFSKSSADEQAHVSVLVTCYKYGREAIDALASLLNQDEPILNIVLIDDASPDDSVSILATWLSDYGAEKKFANIRFIQHLENHGLSQARNTALSLIDTPYVFILDADNQLYPRALRVLREALENSGYAMAYSLIEKTGAELGIMGNSLWMPEQFSYGNYIDALALIRTDVLKELGGYREMPNRFGWEDYDLWCSFVDRGLKGCHVPQILCRYSVHEGSMIQTSTRDFTTRCLKEVQEDFEAHHSMPFYLCEPS